MDVSKRYAPAIQRARQAGYSDAEISQYVSKLEPSQPKTGQGGFLTNLLPTAGGVVGGVVGSLGGPLGTAAGGAAGSGFGEFLRQKLSGEEVDLGTIGRETAFGAIPGAGKLIGTVAKGVKAGAKVGDVARATVGRQPRPVMPQATATPAPGAGYNTQFVKQPTQAATELPQPTTTAITTPTLRDKVLNTAQQSEARAGGFNVGAKVAGKDPLGLDDSKRITQWLDTKKVPAGNPVNRLQTVEKLKAQAGQNIDSVVSRVDNVRFQPVEIQQVADDFVKDVSKLPGANEAMIQRATEYATNLTKGINSPRSAVDFKRQLDDTISYVSSPDAATATEQQVAKLLRGKLVDFTNQRIPGLKKFNDDYYNASDAAKYLTQASRASNDLQLFGTTIPGSGGLRKTASSIGGQKVRKALEGGAQDTVEGGTKKGFSQFIKPTVQQASVRALGSGVFGTPFVGTGKPAEDITGEGAAATALPQEAVGTQQMPGQSQQYYEAAQQALQAGDLKSYETLLGLAENAMKFESAGKGKPLSAEASKVIANAQSGLTSLDQVRSMLQKDPSLLGRTAIPFREQLGGLGASALGTSSYDTATRNIADVITRLRTGAAITENEEKFYRSQLPQPFDPPETVEQKLQMFEQLFGSVASRNPSYSENSAADAFAR